MNIPDYERSILLDCPVCKDRIVYDVAASEDTVICPKCKALVEVPASKKQEAALFKAISEQFMNK